MMKQWSVIFFAVGMTLAPSASFAFSIQPAITDIALDPGQEKQGTLVIANDKRDAQTYRITIQKFLPQGDLGQQTFLPEQDRSGLPEWIKMDRDALTLGPHETGAVRWMIRVPQDARPGGYYAAMFATAVSDDVAHEPMPISARIGSLIFLRVNGDVAPVFFLREFFPSEKTFSHLPVSFSAVIANRGNTHGVPKGEIIIKNFFGRIVKTISLNADGARVLPDSERRLTATWQDAEPSEGKGFWYDVKEEWKNFGIGTYTITASLESSSVSVTERVSIWPVHLMIAVFVLLFVAVITFYVYGRLVLRRATAR